MPILSLETAITDYHCIRLQADSPNGGILCRFFADQILPNSLTVARKVNGSSIVRLISNAIITIAAARNAVYVSGTTWTAFSGKMFHSFLHFTFTFAHDALLFSFIWSLSPFEIRVRDVQTNKCALISHIRIGKLNFFFYLSFVITAMMTEFDCKNSVSTLIL